MEYSHMERKEFELKAKDKVVQKMTRDGLVDENLADKTTKKARPGDPTHEQETDREMKPTPEQKPRGQPKRRPTARKRQALLQEKPLVAETGQSRRETAKPGDAPKEKQKKKYAAKLRFDDQPKSSKFAPVAKPAGVGAMYMKSKLHQRTDDDNLAVTAAQRTEQQTEAAAVATGRTIRKRTSTTKARRAVGLDRRTVRTQTNRIYRWKAESNAQVKNASTLGRAMQKHAIKKQYAKGARKAAKAAAKTGKAARNTARTAGVLMRHPVALVVAVAVIVLIIFFASLVATAGAMIAQSSTAMIGTA